MLDYWMEKEGKRQIFIIFFKARPILLIVMRAMRERCYKCGSVGNKNKMVFNQKKLLKLNVKQQLSFSRTAAV